MVLIRFSVSSGEPEIRCTSCFNFQRLMPCRTHQTKGRMISRAKGFNNHSQHGLRHLQSSKSIISFVGCWVQKLACKAAAPGAHGSTRHMQAPSAGQLNRGLRKDQVCSDRICRDLET